jgi:hypothetical protein
VPFAMSRLELLLHSPYIDFERKIQGLFVTSLMRFPSRGEGIFCTAISERRDLCPKMDSVILDQPQVTVFPAGADRRVEGIRWPTDERLLLYTLHPFPSHLSVSSSQ